MMQDYDLYKDIAERTQGDIYIGVVGPVRTGKSTFIARFMQQIVLPGIENAHIRLRTQDELPQSGSGRMIMTTQPAFVPNEAIKVELSQGSQVRIRLVDSVGYLIDGVQGVQDGDALRMIHTPWSQEEIPFERAAEIGTKKVIEDHSNIGLVITTDGSVTELPRSAYVPAEERVISELKSLSKPFVVILNTESPAEAKTQNLRKKLEENYGVPVVAMNVARMEEGDIQQILDRALKQFPAAAVYMQIPEWVGALDDEHWLIKSLVDSIQLCVTERFKLGRIDWFTNMLAENCEYADHVNLKEVYYGSGEVSLQIGLREGLFNQVLAEQCGTEIRSDAHLLTLLRELVEAKKEYDHVAQALQSVRETGYGLVPPMLEEMTLQEPEIMKQGGRFGVRLRASAPSLHMIRVDIQTEVSPVVGTEQQSEELIRYLMEGFEQDTQKLWSSNLFGKPLSELVREGLSNKLMRMPSDAQLKVQQTLQKIINEGNGGMVCILL